MNDIVVQIEGVGELRFPEGTSMDVIQAKVKELTAPKLPNIKEDPLGWAGETILGQLESAGTMMTGAVADPLAKLTDIATTGFTDTEAGNVAGQQVREAMTYMPRTEGGQAVLGSMGEVLAPVGEAFKYLGEQVKGGVEYATGSEKAGEMTKDVLSLIPDVAGVAALTARGPIILKQNGRPTPELQQMLEKQGVVYEALTPEAQAAIPDQLPATVAPGSQTKRTSEQAVVTDISAGGKQAGLAEKQVSPKQTLMADPLAQEAVKQGFEPRVVQRVKTATPETRADMDAMLKRFESFKVGGTDLRPSDIAGQAVVDRVKFIRDKANEARAELNQIAKQNLAGKPIDASPIQQTLGTALDELGVTVLSANGKPVISFKGSIIEKDPGSQRAITDLMDLMSGGAPADALRFHNLKRQIDALVDYGKAGKEGIPASGEQVLKQIRRALNTSLRAVDEDYARVNDVLSTSIKTFDDIGDSVGTKIDIFGASADRGIGQQLRRLFSNTQARVAMEDAIKQLDDVANQFGGNFNNSAYDLSLFATHLDKRFGTVADTSIQGVMESAVNRGTQAATQGVSMTAAQMASDFVKRKTNEARGINDYNAMRAMEQLLLRGANQ
jgi:hypothetical protein